MENNLYQISTIQTIKIKREDLVAERMTRLDPWLEQSHRALFFCRPLRNMSEESQVDTSGVCYSTFKRGSLLLKMNKIQLDVFSEMSSQISVTFQLSPLE